jgi:F0F1-type ATP synthase membrane subunit c/vacuolar-type H+-ATPase subunit K
MKRKTAGILTLTAGLCVGAIQANTGANTMQAAVRFRIKIKPAVTRE